MKKFNLLIIAFLGISLGAFAQNNPSFGLRAGYNLSTWGGQSVEDFSNLGDQFGAFKTEPTSGFHAGGYVNIPVSPNFAIEPGIQYSQKGMRVSQTFLDGGEMGFLSPRINVTSNMHYIDMPLLAKFTTNQGLQFFAGPQFSYLLDQNATIEGGILGFSYGQDFELNRGFRKFDVAISAGMGYQMQSGVNFSASYDYGLNSLDEGASNIDAYNRVAKVSIGYQF
ncbi:MAG: porin family protein [Cyclobacteriaceae bacterium]